MTFVKICGLTNSEDAQMSLDLGADFLGFVNAENSPRYLTPDEISRIITEVSPLVPTVMVTHSQDISVILNSFEASGADILQLHAPLHRDEYQEIKDLVPKVIANVSIDAALKEINEKIKSRICETSEIVDFILFDTKFGNEIGGTGKTYDWSIAAELKEFSNVPVIIAGGLNHTNVALAVREVAPYAVDVSSGVESVIGQKDPDKVREFIVNAKSP